MSQLFALGGQNISTSASVLPVNIQGWFPLGVTGWISLRPRDSHLLLHHGLKASVLWRSAFFPIQLSHCWKLSLWGAPTSQILGSSLCWLLSGAHLVFRWVLFPTLQHIIFPETAFRTFTVSSQVAFGIPCRQRSVKNCALLNPTSFHACQPSWLFPRNFTGICGRCGHMNKHATLFWKSMDIDYEMYELQKDRHSSWLYPDLQLVTKWLVYWTNMCWRCWLFVRLLG